MTRDELKQEIQRSIPATRYLTKSKGQLYICPFCGSGTHENGTGAVKYYPETNTFHCFSCEKSGDVFDLYQQEHGVDFSTSLAELGQELHLPLADSPETPFFLPVDDFSPISKEGIPQTDPNAVERKKSRQNGERAISVEKPDYTAYYRQCRARLSDPLPRSYLAARGITIEAAAAYWLGYDPQSDPAAAPGGIGDIKHPCPRLIIPTTTAHYIGRSIDPATDKAFAKMNNKGGKPGLFNQRALYAQEVQEVFICEGALDALSVIEAGAAAIALNSTSNADALIKQLERQPTAATLILCLDNDEAGRKATQTIRQGLDRLNLSHVAADICGGRKDPNEFLQQDRDGFFKAIRQAQTKLALAKPDNTLLYLQSNMAEDIESFKKKIETGYPLLDQKAGGLYAGLYCIAAISSLGKTTFAAQMADQIAAAGNDVLYFSLEQSRLEMVSKSLARITAQNDLEHAVTSLAIRRGFLPPQVLQAEKQYEQEVQDRLSIIEGNFNCNIPFIGEYIRRYIRRNRVKPVVFIDYLQILQGDTQSASGRQSVKEMVDGAVTALKRISRENELTVFIISSVNRANYLTPIDFESLKESGGIEYTCDVIWGLQLQCLNDPLFDKVGNIKEKRETIKEEKAKNPRKIELICLKNRYGISSFSTYFNYYPANDWFQENPESEYAIFFSGQEQTAPVYHRSNRK